jgi:photosystem II stability/assembly factor-like uncharacterized protein
MTSAMTGWALYYSGNPSSSPGALLLARTTDGGRSWTDVTPAAARPMLATADATQAVDPVGGDRAYLAVTGATEESNSSVNTTMVFATTDGGRTWIDSAPLRAVSTVSEVSFADLRHGFLLLGGGDGAMGEDSVWLYRTADGGAHWSLAAATTPAPTGTAVSSQPGLGQIPAACDKSGLAFPTATNGWIASTCNAGLADALLVSQDSGVSWADESLPLPATICSAGACTVSGPQFLDRTGFVTVDPEPDGAALLVTRDLGQTWDQLPLPAGLQYPQITFFSPTQGVLVAGETQGAFGGTFYTTADGGRTWTPVPQGANLTRLGVSIDFATPEDGFAWTNGLESDPVPPTSIYETTNSGRSWHAFTPKLAA